MKKVGDMMKKYFHIIALILLFLILLLTGCHFLKTNDNKMGSDSSDSNITITEPMPKMNKIVVEDVLFIFEGMYDPEMKAKVFIDHLNYVGITDPSTIEISETDDRVIVVEILENDIKYYVTLSAEDGYIGVIYKDELGGEPIFYHTDD